MASAYGKGAALKFSKGAVDTNICKGMRVITMFKSVIDVNDSLFTKVELCRETLEKSRHIGQTYKNVFNTRYQ